jgi:hypothetical protein
MGDITVSGVMQQFSGHMVKNIVFVTYHVVKLFTIVQKCNTLILK